MIFKRLKKSTPEEEEKFREMMTEANLTAKDKFAMIISAILCLVLPAAIFLIGLCLLVLWALGIL